MTLSVGGFSASFRNELIVSVIVPVIFSVICSVSDCSLLIVVPLLIPTLTIATRFWFTMTRWFLALTRPQYVSLVPALTKDFARDFRFIGSDFGTKLIRRLRAIVQ